MKNKQLHCITEIVRIIQKIMPLQSEKSFESWSNISSRRSMPLHYYLEY